MTENLSSVNQQMKSAIGLFTFVVIHFRSCEIHLGGYYSIKKHKHEMQRKVASQMNLKWHVMGGHMCKQAHSLFCLFSLTK